ncbi:MAG: hypothetical protein Q4F57_08845, partial [Weeksellaceae bacterium]|nr:hypothetical protein [Weeksellaceae bacterium]
MNVENTVTEGFLCYKTLEEIIKNENAQKMSRSDQLFLYPLLLVASRRFRLGKIPQPPSFLSVTEGFLC